MSLFTKCAHCGTTFRVTEAQLQAHAGKVRCGTCRTVFNALDALVAAAAAAPDGDAPELLLQAPAVAPARKDAAAPETAAIRAGETPAPAVETLAIEEGHTPFAPRPRHAGWWTAGAVLLALLLLGQAVFLYRSALAARYPGLKPFLVQLCELAGCVVAPPQQPRQIAIEASDLQAVDSAQPGLIQLTATLRNHAGHEIGYPALDLVLTNTKEHTLARRVFLPREYLARNQDVTRGIPANGEITVRLDLDTGDLNAAGFRLDLLPAPPP